jgi:hypothetical protein
MPLIKSPSSGGETRGDDSPAKQTAKLAATQAKLLADRVAQNPAPDWAEGFRPNLYHVDTPGYSGLSYQDPKTGREYDDKGNVVYEPPPPPKSDSLFPLIGSVFISFMLPGVGSALGSWLMDAGLLATGAEASAAALAAGANAAEAAAAATAATATATTIGTAVASTAVQVAQGKPLDQAILGGIVGATVDINSPALIKDLTNIIGHPEISKAIINAGGSAIKTVAAGGDASSIGKALIGSFTSSAATEAFNNVLPDMSQKTSQLIGATLSGAINNGEKGAINAFLSTAANQLGKDVFKPVADKANELLTPVKDATKKVFTSDATGSTEDSSLDAIANWKPADTSMTGGEQTALLDNGVVSDAGSSRGLVLPQTRYVPIQNVDANNMPIIEASDALSAVIERDGVPTGAEISPVYIKSEDEEILDEYGEVIKGPDGKNLTRLVFTPYTQITITDRNGNITGYELRYNTENGKSSYVYSYMEGDRPTIALSQKPPPFNVDTGQFQGKNGNVATPDTKAPEPNSLDAITSDATASEELINPSPVPIEDAQVIPAPAEPAPAEPAPAEPTPVEPTPAEPTPAEPTPVETNFVAPEPVVPEPVVTTPVSNVAQNVPVTSITPNPADTIVQITTATPNQVASNTVIPANAVDNKSGTVTGDATGAVTGNTAGNTIDSTTPVELTTGNVTGSSAGADTAGNNTNGTNAIVANNANDDTSGNNTAGNNTAGNNTAGNNTAGNNTSGNNTAGTSSDELLTRFNTRVDQLIASGKTTDEATNAAITEIELGLSDIEKTAFEEAKAEAERTKLKTKIAININNAKKSNANLSKSQLQSGLSFLEPKSSATNDAVSAISPLAATYLSAQQLTGNFESPLAKFLKSQDQSLGQENKYGIQPQGKVMNDPSYSYGTQRPIEDILNMGAFQAPDASTQNYSAAPALPYAKGGMAGTRHGKYAAGGLSTPLMAAGGKMRVDFRHGDAVTGAGDGQSDDIPAMLADGEFVFPADVVAAIGNGSTKAGSDKLYDMMHGIRAHARSAKPKDLPPQIKSPLDFLKRS